MEITQLHITPIMQGAKHLVLVNGDTPVFLSLSRFELVAKGLVCRITKPQGCFMAQDLGIEMGNLYQLVCRLRNDVRDALLSETRELLITNPGRSRYRIDLDKECVAIDPGIQDLVPHTLAAKDVDILLKHYEVRSARVNFASAQAVYDSLQATRTQKTRPTSNYQPQHERHLMKPGILVKGTCCGIERLWRQVQHCATERYPFAVDIDVVHVDTVGLATVIVTNGDRLFTDVFTFRYCSATEFQQLAIDFIQGQRRSSSDGDCQSA